MSKYIIFGPPGSGKGTTAKAFAKHIGFSHISSGDAFRAEIASGTELGKRVRECIAKGGLVDDTTTSDLILHQLEGKDDFILDGYPRTMKQAASLVTTHRIQGIIQVVLSDQEIISRIAMRRVCPRCGSTYHLKFLPPKKEGACDRCSATLIQREDDKPETVKKRLEGYKKTTSPALHWLMTQGIPIIQVPGDYDLRTESDRVFTQLRAWQRVVESQ